MKTLDLIHKMRRVARIAFPVAVVFACVSPFTLFMTGVSPLSITIVIGIEVVAIVVALLARRATTFTLPDAESFIRSRQPPT
jgi:hypothetical protein